MEGNSDFLVLGENGFMLVECNGDNKSQLKSLVRLFWLQFFKVTFIFRISYMCI